MRPSASFTRSRGPSPEYGKTGIQALEQVVAAQPMRPRRESQPGCPIGYQGELGVKGESGILHTMASRAEFLRCGEHRLRFSDLPKRWLVFA